MATSVFIGLGSGLAAALLFYSAAMGGAVLMLLLFILIPLPLLIAGFGWGMAAAIAGTIAGAGAMASAGGPLLGLWFVLVLGLPVIATVWMVEAGAANAKGSAVVWFPAGHIVGWLGAVAAALPFLIALPLGGTFEPLRGRLLPDVKRLAEQFARQPGGVPATDERVAQMTSLIIELMPAMIAAYWLALFVLNVYLAGRITRASGRLVRPWPDLHTLAQPVWLPLIFAVGTLLAMLPGVARTIGVGITGAMLFAYVVFGLSVLHAISAGRVPWLLWLVYPSFLFGQPIALVALVGLTEPLFKFRNRFRKPPAPPGTII